VEVAALVLVIVLGAALGAAAVAIRRRDTALAAIAHRLGATSSSTGALLSAAQQLEARAVAAEHRLDRWSRDVSFFGELVGVGFVRLDGELRVDLANPAAHALLEQPPGQLVGRSVMEAFVDARIESLVDAAWGGGSPMGELSIGLVEPRTIVIRARRSPVRGIWIVMEDVSELRRLQQIRAEFIDNLSHELRTPLTTVSLLAETLARDAALHHVPERMRDRIGKIEVETGHLVQMVNELLDLSRIESGGSLALRDEVDLGELAVASLERLRLFADRQGVTLAVDVTPDLPLVRGDEDRLAQVLVNLLHNAVKFSHDEGAVVVTVRLAEGAVITSVSDQGPGIPRADRARIFERFYKVDRARVRGGGTGLGLAISRHVVEQHGGRIWVASEEGRGSTFSFSIPVPDGSAETGTAENAARETGTAATGTAATRAAENETAENETAENAAPG
jgi:two-component system, OmpR family, phosphate regulon sensor histidine kinase PhoR